MIYDPIERMHEVETRGVAMDLDEAGNVLSALVDAYAEAAGIVFAELDVDNAARTAVKDPARWTADEIIEVIPKVLDDPEAVGALLRLLAVRAPHRAQQVLDTIELAIELRRSSHDPQP